jgi:nucleoside phosphorylase
VPYPLFEGAHHGQGIVLLQTGVGPDRAREAAAWLLAARPCRGIFSIGLSGGLQAGLAPGAMVIGDRWVVPGDPALPRAVGPPAGDHRLRDRAVRAAVAFGCRPCEGILLTVDRVIGGVEEKRSLAARTGAVAVDMESGAIAEAAAAAAVEMAAVRVILDSLDEPLETLPERYVRADGSLSLWRSGLAVAAHPGLLPRLWLLGRRGTAAMALAGRWLRRFLEEAAVGSA